MSVNNDQQSRLDHYYQIGDWASLHAQSATSVAGSNHALHAQFAPLYNARMQSMKPVLMDRMNRLWGGSGVQIHPRIAALAEINDSAQEVAVLGTLIKLMPKKPMALQFYAEDKLSSQPLQRSHHGDTSHFCSAEDKLELEDDTARIDVVIQHPSPDFSVASLVTGLIVGLRGHVLESGSFLATAICLPEPAPFGAPPQNNPPAPPPGERWVAFVSGLNLISNPDLLRVELLFEALAGFVDLGPGHARLVSRTVRTFFVGGVFCAPASPFPPAETFQQRLPLIDRLFAELATTMPFDLVPCSADPSNFQFPHEPFNPCLFPLAAKLSAFRAASNPHRCWVDDCDILCEAGDVASGLAQCSSVQDPIVQLQNLLRWRHIVPIAPDLIPCHPFTDRDPFLLSKSPRILASGGAEAFQSLLWEHPHESTSDQPILLLTIPSFEKTAQIVFVELSSLQTKTLTISHSL